MFRKKIDKKLAANEKEVEKVKQQMRRDVKRRIAPVFDVNRLYEKNGITLRIYIATHGGKH